MLEAYDNPLVSKNIFVTKEKGCEPGSLLSLCISYVAIHSNHCKKLDGLIPETCLSLVRFQIHRDKRKSHREAKVVKPKALTPIQEEIDWSFIRKQVK